VVTNQSGIGRGLYTEDDFHLLTDWMRERFAQAGAPLAGVYHCPHHPSAARGELRRDCDCRKPAPGMLLRAIDELGLDPARSAMFGDHASDLQAAADAGVPLRVWLATDGVRFDEPAPPPHMTHRYTSLAIALADPALRARLARA